MGEPVVTLDEAASLRANDDAALWLAACDERLASGESIASLEEVGVPAALRPQLEVEAAWCQLVRRIWPDSTEADFPATDLWSGNKAGNVEEHPTELGRFVIRREPGAGRSGSCTWPMTRGCGASWHSRFRAARCCFRASFCKVPE